MIEVPAFPLSVAHLPGDRVSLRVFEDRYLDMVSALEETARAGEDPLFVTMLIERGSEVGGGDVRCDHGVLVLVDQIDHGIEWCVLAGRATNAVTVREWIRDVPFPMAVVGLQHEEVLSARDRFDVASALSLLSGRILRVLGDMGIDAGSVPHALRVMADGRWWDESVSDDELWRAFWTLGRAVPCGPLDRHQLLIPGALTARTRTTREIIEHLEEVLAFGASQ